MAQLDESKLAELREKFFAPLAHELEAIANERPELGQYVTSAFNHVRYGFNDLGHALALLKGLDPFANKVAAPTPPADVQPATPTETTDTPTQAASSEQSDAAASDNGAAA